MGEKGWANTIRLLQLTRIKAVTGSYRSSDDANIHALVSKFGCLQFVYRTLQDTVTILVYSETHALLKYGSGKHPRGKWALPTMADPHKLLGYRFTVCFSLAYRSSLISMILPLLMQWQYATVNFQRVWTTTQRWWENTLLDVWKVKSSVIFQLAKKVLNRKQKDQGLLYMLFAWRWRKNDCLWQLWWMVYTMRAASIAWYHMRHGLTDCNYKCT